MVSGRGEKHLGFMFEPPEGFRMNNPVAITLKNCPQVTGVRFLVQAAPGINAATGVGRKHGLLLFFKLTTN